MAILISTNFTSDFADVYNVALDIYARTPLKNLADYPNIPDSLHLNMPALVLSQVFKIFGPAPRSAKLFWILMDTLSTFLVYQTGKMISNEKTGTLAAFLYALLPSVSIYSGTLAGEYLAFPFMLSASIIYVYLHSSKKTLKHYFLGSTLLGMAIGIMDWFRPLGIVLLIAFIIDNLINSNFQQRILRSVVFSLLLFISYSLIIQLAVSISEYVFEERVRGTSERIGEYFIKGLNPASGGQITLEDNGRVQEAYKFFGDDTIGAQKYLIQFAVSRLDGKTFIQLAKEKFFLIWSDHDALFDYASVGSNDDDFIDLLRNLETLMWIVITMFLIFNAYTSIRKPPSHGIFSMQLFLIGFALLLIFMEVQNRYITAIIPYSILLSATGINQFLKR